MKRILFVGFVMAIPVALHAQSTGLRDAYGTCEGNAHIQDNGTLIWTGDFARYCPNVVARFKAAQDAAMQKINDEALANVRRYGQ